MQHEFPKKAAHTLKEFAGEFLMVVVSIITALTLEHLVSERHHRHMAELARQSILQELKANIEAVQAGMEDAKMRADGMDQAITELRKELKAGMGKTEFCRLYPKRFSTFTFGVNKPSLRHEAWDVAVANQAGPYLDAAAMRRFSLAYTDMRDLQVLYNTTLPVFLDARGMIQLVTDMEAGRAEPVALLRMMLEARSNDLLLVANLAGTKATLEAALKE